MCDCLSKLLNHQRNTASIEYEQGLAPQEKPNENERNEYLSRATETLSPWEDVIKQNNGSIPAGMRRRYHEDIANTLSDYMNEVHQSAKDGDTSNLASLEQLFRGLKTHALFPAEASDVVQHYLLHVHNSGLSPEEFQSSSGITPSESYKKSVGDAQKTLDQFMKTSTDATGRMVCPQCTDIADRIRQASSDYRRQVRPRSKEDVTGGSPSSWVFNVVSSGNNVPSDSHPLLLDMQKHYSDLLSHRGESHITPGTSRIPEGMHIRIGGGADSESSKEIEDAIQDGAANIGKRQDSDFYKNMISKVAAMPGFRSINFPKVTALWSRKHMVCPNNPEHTNIYENISNTENPKINFECGDCLKEAQQAKDPEERQVRMENARFENPILATPQKRLDPTSYFKSTGVFTQEEADQLRGLFEPGGENRWSKMDKKVTPPGEVTSWHSVPSSVNRVIIPLPGFREMHLKNVPFEEGYRDDWNDGQTEYGIRSTPRGTVTSDPWSPAWDKVIDPLNIVENARAGRTRPYLAGRKTRQIAETNPWLHGATLHLFDLAERKSGWAPDLTGASNYMRDSANPQGATRPVFETRKETVTTPGSPERVIPEQVGEYDLHAFTTDNRGIINPLVIDGRHVIVGTINSKGETKLKKNHQGQKALEVPFELTDDGIEVAARSAQNKSIKKSMQDMSSTFDKAREMFTGEVEPSTGIPKNAPKGSFVDPETGYLVVDHGAIEPPQITEADRERIGKSSGAIYKRTKTRLSKQRDLFIQWSDDEIGSIVPTKSGPATLRSRFDEGQKRMVHELVYPTITPIDIDHLQNQGYRIDTITTDKRGYQVPGARPEGKPEQVIPETPSETKEYSREVKVGDRPFDDAIDRKAFESNMNRSIRLALLKAFPGMAPSEASTLWQESWKRLDPSGREGQPPIRTSSKNIVVTIKNAFKFIKRY
jgi:hypothetical protein